MKNFTNRVYLELYIPKTNKDKGFTFSGDNTNGNTHRQQKFHVFNVNGYIIIFCQLLFFQNPVFSKLS